MVSAKAFSINCSAPQDFHSQGRRLEATAQGRWETLGFGHARLSYDLQYGIDCVSKEGSCWASAQSSGAGLVANREYRPVRYQNFQQFTLESLPHVEHGFLLLPESLVDESTSFRAYMMLDAVHGSFGATVPLLCQGEPVTSLSSPVSENAPSEIARADRIIQEEYGFPQLRLLADAESLQKQIELGATKRVSLSQATQLAMAVILDDFQAIEAPLNIAAHGWASTHNQQLRGELTLDQKTEARRFLRQQMQQTETSLALYQGVIIKGQNYPPEQGENTQENWIFVLHVPTLSDHLYWVIVDRKGQKAPYLYGFN
jgi:hypothetical protein